MAVNAPFWSTRTTRMLLSGACCVAGLEVASVAGSIFWPTPHVDPPAPSGPQIRKTYHALAKTIQVDTVVGDFIFVGFSLASSTLTISCGDGVNEYRAIGTGQYVSGSSISGFGFYAIATTTGTITITITHASSSNPCILVDVWTGLVTDGSIVLDQYAYNPETAGANTHTTASIANTNADDLLLTFWFQDSSSAYLTDSDRTWLKTQEIATAGSVMQTIFHKTVGATGTYAQTITTTSTPILGSLICSFKVQAAAGTATANATVVFTEAADTASLQTKADAGAVLAATEAQDTAALTLLEVVATSLAFTEAADTASLQATVTAGLTPLNAILAYTEAQDVAALLAAAVVNGALTASEAVDTFSLLAGAVAGAALGATEASDIASLQATARAGAVLAFTEDPDTASLQAAAPTALALAADENPDTCLLYAGEAAPNDAKISLVGMLVNVGTLLNRS